MNLFKLKCWLSWEIPFVQRNSTCPDPLTSSFLCFLWQKEQGIQNFTPAPLPRPLLHSQPPHSQPSCHRWPQDNSINPILPFVSCLIPKQLQVPRSHCIPCILIIPSLSFPPVPSYLPKPLPRCSLERMGHSSAKSTQYSLSLNTVRSALRQQKSRCYLKLSYKNHRAYGKKQYGGRIVKKFVCDISEKHRNQKQWRNLTPVRWWKKT